MAERHDTRLLERAIEIENEKAEIPVRHAEALNRALEEKARAEAEAEVLRAEAERIRAQATADAERLRAESIADAERIRARGAADAELIQAETTAQVRKAQVAMEEAKTAAAAALERTKAEGATFAQKMEAEGKRRFRTGTGIAVAALGLGLGAWMGLPSLEAARHRTTAAPPEQLRELAERATPTTTADGAAAKVVTDFAIFNTATLERFGRSWEIKAGHQFVSAAEANWSHAWCYITPSIDGVIYHLDLAERSAPDMAPSVPEANAKALAVLGLGQQAHVGELAGACPWLDGVTPTSEAAPDSRSASEEPRPAAAIAEDVSIRLVGGTLRYNGPIGADFAEVLSQRRFERLEIDSTGGLLEPALAAGRQLRKRGVDVRVTANCASACVFVLAGGRHRSAARGARIGVHRFWTEQKLDAGEALADAQATSSELIRHLQAMGVSVDLFHEMAAVPAERLRELDHVHLRRLGLLTS